MSNRSIGLSEDLQEYILGHGMAEPDILRELRAETAGMEDHQMQIAPEQGLFMAMLAKLTGTKRYLEIGTFTGYSALTIALALPDDGEVVALDCSEEYTGVARRYWQKAGVSDRISLHIAPALETLAGALGTGQDGTFDMAFIDADKENYVGYFEHCLRLVRSGGLILIDNVLWNGSVIDAEKMTETTQAIRAFNKHVAGEASVEVIMTPIGDGLTLARKL